MVMAFTAPSGQTPKPYRVRARGLPQRLEAAACVARGFIAAGNAWRGALSPNFGARNLKRSSLLDCRAISQGRLCNETAPVYGNDSSSAVSWNFGACFERRTR